MYGRSSRRYPRQLMKVEFCPFSHVVRIDKNGFIKWHRRKIFISSALKCEYVELDPSDRGWDVRWGAIPLGRLDEHRPERGLVTPHRKRGSKEVSGMSLV